MRFAFFDGLLEDHVPASLQRALESRGHTVYNTGKIGHGFVFETQPDKLSRINRYIDETIAAEPDFILVFRPASLPPNLLDKLRRTGAQLAVWLSDDPVLWDLSYRPVVDLYDIVLNSGSERVLKFYDSHFGRAVGVNFPFWTDNLSFPYVYGEYKPETVAMFLGNVQDEVRRNRYFNLTSLSTNLRIHGNTGIDFRNVSGGYLDSDREVVQAAARAKLAINIPQYFSDHSGLPTWFAGLDALGTFQYPSRVIQYAAMGLPIVSVTPDRSDYDTFPELQTVSSVDKIDEMVEGLLSSESRLSELSTETHNRFRSHFSAHSRAMALEHIAQDDTWRALSAGDRARWFTQFDAAGELRETHASDTPEEVFHCTTRPDRISTDLSHDSVQSSPSNLPIMATVARGPSSRIAVIGEGWTRASSPVSVAHRALINLGHQPIRVSPLSHPKLFVQDKSREFRCFVVTRLLAESVKPDLVLFVGNGHGITESGRHDLRARNIPVIVHHLTNRTLNLVSSKLVGRADAVTVTHPDLHTAIEAAGFRTVKLLPPLVDRSFTEIADSRDSLPPKIRTIGARRNDLTSEKNLLEDLAELDAVIDFAEDADRDPLTVDELVDYVRSSVAVVGFDSTLPDSQPSEYFAFALAAGALVVTPRSAGAGIAGEPGESHITARDRGEVKRKLARLSEDEADYRRYISRARELSKSLFSAEAFIGSAIHSAKTHADTLTTGTSSIAVQTPYPNQGTLQHQNWRSTLLGVSATRLKLAVSYHPPEGVLRTRDVSFRVRLGDLVVARLPLTELQGEHTFFIDLPSRYPERVVTVELYADQPLSFFNWRRYTELTLAFSESALTSHLSTVQIGKR
ncbi:glycosyltransferase family protein [Brevibacterium jeotgali]|uniref:Spore protein YkvP/CgeB glycosyl transferase-like domain-containing protein n=1 Tax=Brevibacterium jeotgali TaxID=1262550 RepID=A0A2H1L8S6_9MICO|nr:hypothetical protein [Brevibacterium jeotgali]TWC03400.1 hypothetical protein FB108_2128 [Brevibacterium jeotgali]SMY13259.1 hypothetical protein BJEO58_02871 [Brevibacterium jeotgali]